MILERLVLQNFRGFGPTPGTIRFGHDLTALVGANGAGKTAVMQALQRLFGVSGEQRRLRRHDFHVPVDEKATPAERTLSLEAVFAFPELGKADADDDAVPAFFEQMAADEGGTMKCRLRLEATWTDDGSVDGAIDFKYFAVRTLSEKFSEEECSDLSASDRARVQLVYIPATRDGASQVTSFLRGRLWRAINWSLEIRKEFLATGSDLNTSFGDETAVALITEALAKRWQQVHTGGTDADPKFRPIDLRFEEFVRKIEVLFEPDEERRARGLEELSDGQRSIFHIAMTAATLDVERRLTEGQEGFKAEGIALPALTLVALEEPENNLAPFYLSRIIRQLQDVAKDSRAQAFVSSHSASILARIDPEAVRHLRLVPETRSVRVREIPLPDKADEASKFIREAVRTYPELYFASFVVLGEGASEEIVIPPIADALGLPLDRSFVAVVPLGGRHVNHLWRLLSAIDIPFATLLDLDWGREGGGWLRIKNATSQLLQAGIKPGGLFTAAELKPGVEKALEQLGAKTGYDFKDWLARLRKFAVYFCDPLDLDMAMMTALPKQYRALDKGMAGPATDDDPAPAVLGKKGNPAAYEKEWVEDFRWYRYLFLGRGKPVTYLRALTRTDATVLAKEAPEVLISLLRHVADAVGLAPDEDDA